MIRKILIFFLILTSQLVFANIDLGSLPSLNYELIESLNPVDGEPSKHYQFSTSPQAKATKGILMIRNMKGEFNDCPVWIEADGTVWGENKTKGRRFGLGGGYGEKFQFLLLAVKSKNDLKPLAKGEIVPFPLVANDDIGHKIEVIADAPDGKHFTIMGSGFRPKEIITFNSRSCHEQLHNLFTADEQGKFQMGYAPGVLGEIAGPFQLTFCGEKMEPLILRHYWGKIAFYGPNAYKSLSAKYTFPDE